MSPVGPREVARVLEVTDGLGIHREAVRVLLDDVPGGSVRIEQGSLVIVPPTGDVEPWIGGLADRIRALPGAQHLPSAEEP